MGEAVTDRLVAGVDVHGKIALVKYGGVFRGLKVKGWSSGNGRLQAANELSAAEEAGAIGCLIFTDPGDDGEITAENGYDIYPDGPARQPSSVQRGSVQYVSIHQGPISDG